MNLYVIQVLRHPLGKKAEWCDKEDHAELIAAVPARDALHAKGKRSVRIVYRADTVVPGESIRLARRAANHLNIT